MGTGYWLVDWQGRHALDLGKYGGNLLGDHEPIGGLPEWAVGPEDVARDRAETQHDHRYDWGDVYRASVIGWMTRICGGRPIRMVSEHWETADRYKPWVDYETWSLVPGWRMWSPLDGLHETTDDEARTLAEQRELAVRAKEK